MLLLKVLSLRRLTKVSFNKKILIIVSALILSLDVQAAERLYVLLGPDHPKYDAQQPQVVASGFVSIIDFRRDFPSGRFTILPTLPEGAIEYSEPPLSKKLNSLFMAQPVAVRAKFYVLKAGVQSALAEGDTEAARAIIQNVSVPTNLEKLKQDMLGQFN